MADSIRTNSGVSPKCGVLYLWYPRSSVMADESWDALRSRLSEGSQIRAVRQLIMPSDFTRRS